MIKGVDLDQDLGCLDHEIALANHKDLQIDYESALYAFVNPKQLQRMDQTRGVASPTWVDSLSISIWVIRDVADFLIREPAISLNYGFKAIIPFHRTSFD